MSLLGDLQQEVRKIKAREVQENAELEAQKEFYQAHLRPAMVRIYEYFAEIVEHLNIVEPDVKARYPLNPQLENGVALKQSQYKFRSDNRESPHQIDIFCKCTLEKPHEFYLSSPKAALNHEELLLSYSFPYHRKNRLDRHHDIKGATFILEGPMTVHIRIAASPADRSIHIGLRNLERSPVKRYKFKPEAIDEQFLERLAKVLIRQVPQLVEFKVDNTLRDKLRNQLDRDQYLTEQDFAQAEAERRTEEQSRKQAKLINLNGRKAVERAREVLKVFLRN
jgi:hypothetical protein